MSLGTGELKALSELLSSPGRSVVATSGTQLTGGASRQTFAVETDGGTGHYILQREISPEPRLPNGMADEAKLVTAAGLAGVPAPTVVGTNLDRADALGRSFFVTERVNGETIARRILRDDRFAAARVALPAQLGQALAALHRDVDPDGIGWLEESDELAKYRDVVDELDLVSPAFELAFRWLAANGPDRATTRRTVVHGDFRLGNMIIDQSGLAAVIDWELGHIGDPMEDLGWVCVRAWRFGGPQPVAGVGSYDEFFAAYQEAAGLPVDRAAVRWWETLGTLKWGIMCGTQANRHLSGDVPSVELVSIGPRVAEQEYDVLRLIDPTLVGGTTGDRLDPGTGDGPGDSLEPSGDPVDQGRHATGGAEGGGRPSSLDLVAAVREFLAEDVVAATSGRTGFHVRVAANALATVQRDLQLADQLHQRRAARLQRLGFSTERDLAAAIRAGSVDDRLAEVTTAVYRSVTDRLAVNNPRWIED